MKVMVTGGTGFVGGAILERASTTTPHQMRAAVRSDSSQLPPGVELVVVEGLSEMADWSEAVNGCDAVIHAAARVHVMRDTAADPLAEFRRVNVAGTLSLAHQAARAGVKRFIFISSVKVNGERTLPDRPFSADDKPAPTDPYGITKLEAEQGLRAAAAESAMEVVIIRPPLVYGPGVKANFLSMMRWLRRGIPLPFGAITNKRSLVALDNLTDLVVICLDHPAAADQTFLVSDGEDLSTSELLRRVGKALGRPARLLPVPAWLIQTGANLLGQGAVAQRLCDSLQVDIDKTCRVLGWAPLVKVDQALAKTARHFLEHHGT